MVTRLRFLRAVAIPGLACVLAGATAGCSLIGVGAGHRIDDRRVSRTLSSARELEPGTPVRAHTVDGRVVRGRLESIERCSRNPYEARYAEWRAERGGPWAEPAIGDRIELIGTRGSIGFVRFTGVGFDSLEGIDEATGEFRATAVRGLVAFRDSTGAEHGDGGLPWRDFRSGAPRYEQVRLRTPDGERTFRGEEVKVIRAGGSSRGKVVGLALGMFLDLSALLLAAHLLLPND